MKRWAIHFCVVTITHFVLHAATQELNNDQLIQQQQSEIEYDEEYDNEPSATQDRIPTYYNQNYPIPVKSDVQPNYPGAIRSPNAFSSSARPVNTNKQRFTQREEQNERINPVEKEEEEPDRLSLLLPNSKFNCNGKHTGYYADQDLGCEVFHYCQENVKHSWICPEGFAFHQVHLICMPPGGDNNCEKASDYHFVNDFLYKPLNLEEYQQKPNITLKYSDRYYPDTYRTRYEDEDDETPIHHQNSVRVSTQPRLQPVLTTTFRPQAFSPQVFRSPEEINIPLQQRRPIPQRTNQY